MNILLCGNGKVFDGALTELISILSTYIFPSSAIYLQWTYQE